MQSSKLVFAARRSTFNDSEARLIPDQITAASSTLFSLFFFAISVLAAERKIVVFRFQLRFIMCLVFLIFHSPHYFVKVNIAMLLHMKR